MRRATLFAALFLVSSAALSQEIPFTSAPEPLKLPKGTKIRAVAHYDNSTANKANPDPKVDVKWGDQTWEEMMFTSFVYSIDGVAPGTILPPPQGRGGSR